MSGLAFVETRLKSAVIGNAGCTGDVQCYIWMSDGGQLDLIWVSDECGLSVGWTGPSGCISIVIWPYNIPIYGDMAI